MFIVQTITFISYFAGMCGPVMKNIFFFFRDNFGFLMAFSISL
jgi:hypothetical protein